MRFNAVRLMLLVSLIIILLYVLGLFLPIIKNTKHTKFYNNELIKYTKLMNKNKEYI